ncbi:Rf1 [Symbiodinium microadriaticum]|nr:Rf1 [Symbiodinium microadriaticum]
MQKADVYWRQKTQLVRDWGRQRRWQQAAALFLAEWDTDQLPDLRACNACAQTFARSGRWEEIIQLFACMDRASLSPDAITATAAVGALGKSARWQLAFWLLDDLQQGRLAADSWLLAAASAAAATSGAWEASLIFIDESAEVVTYSSVITACERGGQWQRALLLFHQMKVEGVEANVVTYNTAMTACERGSHWPGSLELFEEMEEHKLLPTVVSFGAAINACGQGQSWERVLAFLAKMRASDVRGNRVIYTGSMDALSSASQWQLALLLWDDLRNDPGNQIDAASFSIAMGAWACGTHWQQALSLLHVLDTRGGIDAAAQVSALGALAAAQQWEVSVCLLCNAEKSPGAAVVAAAGLSAVAAAQRWEVVLRLLEDETLQCADDAVAYGVAMTCCGRTGRWEWSLELLRRLKVASIRSNSVIFNAAIASCDASAEWQRALSMLEDMRHAKVAADVVSYGAAISACEKCKKWRHGLALLDELRGQDLAANVVALSAAIGSCGEVQWRRTLVLLKAMLEQQLQPNEVTFTSIVSACAGALRWEVAVKMLTEMNCCGISGGVVASSRVLEALERAAAAPAAPSTLQCVLARGERLCGELVSEKNRATRFKLSGCCRSIAWLSARKYSSEAMTDTSPDQSIVQAVMGMSSVFLYLSCLCLFFMGQKDVSRPYNMIACLVTFIAGSAYLGMSSGLFVHVVDGRHVYCLRYVDWCFTTALMLLDLALMRGADMKATAALIGIDVAMILMALMAALSTSNAGKWGFFGMGTVCFAGMVAFLFTVLQRAAEERGGEAEGKFKFVASRTIELWCLYPVIFALGELTHTIPEELEVVGYSVADVLAKSGIPMMIWIWSIFETKATSLPTILENEKETLAAVQG